MSAEITTTIAERTCADDGCTYSGTEFYRRGTRLMCGACMDRADDEDMPHLTSEYAWQLLREMDR